MRRLHTAAVLVAAVAAIVLFARRDEPPRPETLAPSSETEGVRGSEERAQAAVEPVGSGSTEDSARAPERAPIEAETPPEVPSASEDELALEGTFVAIDEAEVEHAGESGSFVMTVWRGDGGRTSSVEVEGGRWSARVPRGTTLSFQNVRIGGRSAALVDAPKRVSPPADGRIELRARWVRELVLHVRDEENGEELADVTLVRGAGWPHDDYPHPGDVDAARVAVRHALSPVRLTPAEVGARKYHVGAPGHAWAALEIDPVAGGERVIALARGGGLDVAIAGGPLDPNCVLRVREAFAPPSCEVAVKGRDALALDGLPLGKTRATLEIGNWWAEPLVLAEGEAVVSEGARAFLRLDAGAAPSSASVPLAGEVVVPEAWGLETFLLVIQLLDPPLGGRESIVRMFSRELEHDAADPRVWRWRHPNAQAGRYQVELFQLHYSLSVEVGAAGREDVRLEIPPPAELRVRVVDAADARELESAQVLWMCALPEWVRGGGLARAAREGTSGTFLVRAPRTAIEVHARAEGYANARETADLASAPPELTLRLARVYRIVLSLTDGSTPVPWPAGSVLTWRSAVEGSSARTAWSPGGEGFDFDVPGPGEYRIDPPRIAGYEPLPEQRVEVGPDGRAEVALELVRSP